MYCRRSAQVLVHAVEASDVRRWQVLEYFEIYFVRELVKQGILPLEKVVWMKRAGYITIGPLAAVKVACNGAARCSSEECGE